MSGYRKDMKPRTARIFLVIWVFSLLGPFHAIGAHIAIIGSENYPINQIDQEELKKIYLGLIEHQGGIKIEPIDQSDTNLIKAVFIEQVLFSTLNIYKNHWLMRADLFKKPPPMVRPNPQSVIEAVLSKDNAIGYVWADEALGQKKIKVLLIFSVED